AYSKGFGWALLAMSQVATGYFVLLVLGKKFAIVARRYNAVTLMDFLKERYQSATVVLLSAFSTIVFMFLAMAAQWVGGDCFVCFYRFRPYLCDDWWFSCSSDYRYHSRGCHVYWNAAFTRGGNYCRRRLVESFCGFDGN